jgi:hypothetical protein
MELASTHRPHTGEKGHKDQVTGEFVPDRILATKLHARFRRHGWQASRCSS